MMTKDEECRGERLFRVKFSSQKQSKQSAVGWEQMKRSAWLKGNVFSAAARDSMESSREKRLEKCSERLLEALFWTPNLLKASLSRSFKIF